MRLWSGGLAHCKAYEAVQSRSATADLRDCGMWLMLVLVGPKCLPLLSQCSRLGFERLVDLDVCGFWAVRHLSLHVGELAGE